MSKVEAEGKRFERRLRNDIAPDLAPNAPGAAAAELGPSNARIENRARAFETRAQAITQQARAAGATRTDNDADLLGFTVPKRKGAARAVLG